MGWGLRWETSRMIHVREVTKAYADLERGQFVALAGVSFDALPGQIYGLLGPNGAGKTTLLRILSTVLQPSGGAATINGYNVVTQPALVRRQIGFVSANTAVYDRMTAWEMVEYFGRLYGIDREELRQRMEGIFDRLQMNEIRDVLGAKMSTGMKQKVSIARTRPRSAGADLRRGDRGPGRAGRPGADEVGGRAARPGEVHRLLDPHHARGRTAVRSDCDRASRAHRGRRDARLAIGRTWGNRLRRVVFPPHQQPRQASAAPRRRSGRQVCNPLRGRVCAGVGKVFRPKYKPPPKDVVRKTFPTPSGWIERVRLDSAIDARLLGTRRFTSAPEQIPFR